MPVLLDDGHQSHAIMCDIKIIVIDSLQGIGNGYIFPSGPLRQRFTTGMQEADIVIIVKHSESDLFFHSKEFKYIESKKKYFLCSIKNNISNNNNLYPFCGIGFPWKFFDDLKKSGNNILKTKIFPDHHYYSEKELDELVRDAEKLKAKLTTTEKDIVKIPKKYYNSIQVAQLEIVWEKFDESFFEKIY